MDDVLRLVSETQTQDATGVWRSTETQTQVFCRVKSISRQEFFDAGRAGLNPSLQFDVFALDYAGQKTVVYNGKRYGVYRTYRAAGSDYMELYTEEKGGVNRGAS